MKKANNKKNSVRTILPKVLSVVAAVILWFYVADIKSTDVEKVISGVNVEIINFDNTSGMDIVSGKDYVIDVTVKGVKSKIEEVTSEDISATINMNGIKEPGDYDLDIDVTSKSGITVKSITPGEITVRVDKTSSTHIPVEVQFTCNSIGNDISDVQSSSPLLSASSVQVTGPKKEIEKIEKLVVRLEVDTVTETIVAKNQTLIPVDENGKDVFGPYITLHQSYVDVTIPVYKTKKVEVAPVFEDELNYTYSYKLYPKEITIVGESAYIDSITSIKTRPVDINKNYQNLDLPEGIVAYNENGNRIYDVSMTGIVATPIVESDGMEFTDAE